LEILKMSAPAGWYDDGNGRHRWWDGQSWTEHTRDIAPQGSAAASPEYKSAADVEKRAQVAVLAPREVGVFGKLGASVKKAAADRQAAKDEIQSRFTAREQAAGSLVTSGVFGSSTIGIYEGGYVRVAGPSDSSYPAKVERTTPFEKLISITFTTPKHEKSSAGSPAGLEGAAVQAVTALLKGGAGLMKATVPGLAVTGVAHIAKSMSEKSFLAIATDLEIHTLTNSFKNDYGIPILKKEHEAVGRTLEQVGKSVLRGPGGVPDSSTQPQLATAAATNALDQSSAVTQAALATPGISERLRELASLHSDGILNDAEFAGAKAKLLGHL
jgi:hypothetical protein